MPRTSPNLLPKVKRMLARIGGNIRAARLRRRYSAALVAERAGISRHTLLKVEKGDPAVALGIYARVLQALRLEDDLADIARDDELGRKLQDAELEAKSTRRRSKDAPESS